MIVLKGGEVVDEGGRRRADVAIDDDGFVAAVGDDLGGDREIDCGGCVIGPQGAPLTYGHVFPIPICN